jgi:fatty acid desaturase
MPRKLIERRQRGFFGWIFLLIFWVANGLMALWLFGATSELSKMAKPMTEAEWAGKRIACFQMRKQASRHKLFGTPPLQLPA